MSRALTFGCIAVFFFSGLVFASGNPDIPRVPESTSRAGRLQELGFQVWPPNTAAPDFQLQNLEGDVVSLEELRGNIVLLNFWATWCPPCRNEMPSMEKLHRQLAGSDFIILAVDLQESPEQVRRFVAAAGYSFSVLLDTSGRTGAAYQVSGIPTTYIIDKDGSVLARTVGGRDWHTPEIVALFSDLAK